MVRGTGVKVKKIKLGDSEDTQSLNEMFEQMMGISNADVEILGPKLVQIIDLLKKYKTICGLLSTTKSLCDEEEMKRLEIFVNGLETLISINVTSLDEAKMNEVYNVFKDHEVVKQIIVSCSNLMDFKSCITNKAALSDSFIKKEPGHELAPFVFCRINFKYVWNMEVTESCKKLILTTCHYAYTIGIKLHEILTSPNIDIRRFSSVLISNIGNLRKEIPRCDQAFDLIESSVKLLEDNFQTYYRDSIDAANPSIIVERFVSDISSKQKYTPVVTSQFRRIVARLKQKGGNMQDPKLKKIFGMLNSQYSALDTEVRKRVDAVDIDDDDEEEKK